MNRLILVLVILFSYSCCMAQFFGQTPSAIDSMQHLLEQSAADTNRVKLLYGLSQAWLASEPKKAKPFIEQGLELAQRIGFRNGEAMMLISQGNMQNDSGDRDGALRSYNASLAIYQAEQYSNGICTALNDIGGVWLLSSDYVRATESYSHALDLAIRIGDPNLVGTCYTNLSTIFYNQGNYAKALDYNGKALKQYLQINESEKIARSYTFMGNAYLARGETVKTQVYYNKALEIYLKIGNRTGQAVLYSQIAILFDPDYAKIIRYQERSQSIWDSINPRHYNSIINLGNMGETWLNFIRADTLHKLSPATRAVYLGKAEAYLRRAITYSRETKDADNEGYFSQVLADMQEMSGDYKGALASFRSGKAIQDSLYSQQNKNTIAGLEGKRAITLKDQQLELNRVHLQTAGRQRIALIIGIAMLVIIAGLIWHQSLSRKRTNVTLLQLNNQLDEANKVKAKFFAILSHDLRSPVSNLVSFLELQQDEPGLMTAAESQAHRQTIAASARSLLDTMEAMLLWSKGQMEQFKPSVRAVPVNVLFTHLQEFFGEDSGVTIRYHDAEGLVVQTDENYLQTIMQNLTANAIRVLDKKPGGLIEWKAEQEGEKVLLSITDNGPGIREESLRVLYEDDVVINEKTGLGLHLVRDLARAICCRISVDSKHAEGTTFNLTV